MRSTTSTESNEYKALAVKLSLWGQRHGIPGASPAVLTRLARRIASKKNPKLVERFIKKYGIDYVKAEKCSAANTPGTCARKYGSLNDFFTRHIKGIRVDAGAAVVSPATCKAVVFDAFEGSRIWVKGQMWSAPRLLREPASFAAYAVGIFRLRPADYHRFHIPVAGRVASLKHIRGKYLSVDPAVVGARDVFTENNRVVVELESPRFGRCYVVAVGAAGVGRVVITAHVGDQVRVGDPLGAFEFGGSTVVVLIPNAEGARVWAPELVRASARGEETFVTVGSRVSA